MSENMNQKDILELTEAAEQGEALSQYKLGLLYYNGSDIQKDLEQAELWMNKAAGGGSSDAQLFLGYSFEFGDFGKTDSEQAFFWYKTAAESKNVEAMVCVGNCYMTGTGTQIDTKKAVEAFQNAALHNNPIAQAHMGDFFYFGQYGMPQNYQTAFEWYEKSASQGDAEAQFKLGCCYQEGLGTEKNEEKAVEFYFLSAQQGFVDAQFNLANCYLEGNGTEQSEKNAFDWYLRAAEQGHVASQFNVGLYSYHGGIGIEQNYFESEKWYKIAAENGSAKAAFELGRLYLNPPEGSNIKSSPAEATKYLSQSAELGDVRAMESAAALLATEADVMIKISPESASEALSTLQQSLVWAEKSKSLGNSLDARFYDDSNRIKGNIYTVLFAQDKKEEYLINALGCYRQVASFNNDFDSMFNYAYMASQASECSKEAYDILALIIDNATSEFDKFPTVMYRLSLMYLRGEGCTQDVDKAYELAKRANDLGAHCQDYLSGFVKKLNGHYKYKQ